MAVLASQDCPADKLGRPHTGCGPEEQRLVDHEEVRVPELITHVEQGGAAQLEAAYKACGAVGVYLEDKGGLCTHFNEGRTESLCRISISVSNLFGSNVDGDDWGQNETDQ